MKKLPVILLLLMHNCGYSQFSPTHDYITKYSKQWTVELPEVQELVHCIIAITPTGKEDKNMVMHNTEYYKAVIKHFVKFENHPVVTKVDHLLRDGKYAHVKMDACGFYFDNSGGITKDTMYRQLNWSKKNYIEPLIHQLQDFAIQSNFREFYKSNQQYYDELIELLKIQMPIDKQWQWLEERFPNRYDNYRITFSPLVNGSHSTNRFETDSFKQTVMFICGPIANPSWTNTFKEGLMSRVVFTEIDHNYVNPISDNYTNEIRRIFNDRTKWTSGKDSHYYKSPIAVFNEYMTWAVFSLYAFDTYNAPDFKAINERVELQMTTWRGFSKFSEFNQKLLEFYKNKKPQQTLEDIYPLMIEWCKTQ